MGSDYKKKALAKAKENRANNVAKTNKHFGTETSKSQKAYIAGDIVSSASGKAFGYKKNGIPDKTVITGGRKASNYDKLQNGENPYKGEFIYDGKKRTVKKDDGSTFISRNRYLTDDEKKAVKTTGSTNVTNYEKNYEYSWLKGADSDGKTYGSNFNLRNQDGSMKWDGMNVAKNKVKNGGSKLNYIGGFLKDTVVDAGVDTLKLFDRYESGALGAGLGLVENIDNVASDFSFKNVDMGRIKKNWDASLKESNKTGWGLGAGDYLKQMSQRKDDKMYKNILDKKGQETADKYRSTEQKVQGVENVANGVVGLGLDVLNPVQIGDALVKTLKYAGKGTIKAGKELLNGTADISTAFKVDPLKTQSMVDKYANRIAKSTKNDEALNTLTGQGSINHNKRGSMLDQEYERAMSKADDLKQVIKSNPTTQKLGSFLDEIGTQRSIDGRTLNKKYTQTKDAYTPQTIRGEENVDNIVNNNKSNQLTFNSSNRLNNKYEKLSKTSNNESDLFNTIDNLDDRSSDEFLDWLKTNNPSTYNKYMGNADQLDEFANQGIQTQRLAEKSDNALVNNFNKNAKTISEKPKYDYEKVNHIIDENAKVSSTTTPKKFKNSYERKYEFENSIRNLSKDMYEGKVNADDISQTIQKVKGEDVPVKIKREYVNNKLFGGNEVIASNVSGSSIDGLLDSVEDLTNLKKVVIQYQQTGEVLPVTLSKATKDFLKVDDNLKVVGSKVRGNKMHDPEELVETLNKSIVDRARALTDERYGDKLQLMASEFKYDKYSDVTTALDKLKATRKELDKTKGVSIDEKMELSANIKRLTELTTQREDMWQRIRNLPESDFDKLVDEKYSHHKGSLRSYQGKTEQSKLMEFLSKGDEFNKLLDETADATNNRKLTVDDFYNEVVEEIKGTQKLKDYIAKGGNVDDLIEQQARIKYKDYLNENEGYKLKQNIDNRNATVTEASDKSRTLSESPRLEQSNLSDVGAIVEDADRTELILKSLKLPRPNINKSKIKLVNGQKLGHLPPIKENSAGLKKVIQNELEMMYKEPKKYAEYKDSFKQLKMEYVKSMRSYGVKDSSYFDKVKNLQDDLELYYKELNKPTSIIKKSSEGGAGTPKMGMNLQLLAKKIEDTFNEFDKNIASELESSSKALNATESVSKGPLDKLVDNTASNAKNPFDEVAIDVDEHINDFDKFNQAENVKKNNIKKTSESVSTKSQKPSNEQIDEVLERYKDFGNGEKFDNADDFNAFKDSLDGKTQEQVDKFFNSSNSNNPPTFEKFKKFFGEKSENTKVGYEDSPLYKIYKPWLNSWKKGMTVYNPGWHVQNFFQNKGQNYLALGADAFGSQKNARNVLSQINGVDKGAYELTSKGGKTYTKGELAKMAKDYNVAEGMATSEVKSNGVFPWLEGKIDNSTPMKKALQSEQTARLHHFLTQLERGMNPEDASKSVNKYLFDYGSKSKADKVMSDFVDPFWSFHKSNAKMLTSAPFNHPSKVNNILRANRELDNMVDEDDRTTSKYREHQLPFGSFKDELNGDDYNYFYDENMLPDVDKALPLESDDLNGKLNPLIKIALQQAKGQGNFGNTIVDKDKAGYDEVTKDESLKEIGLELNPVLNTLFKSIDKSKKYQKKADEGVQSQSTSDKQIINQVLAYILGNKGNYYRDTR